MKVQADHAGPHAGFWLPLSWEVKLLGDPAFGAGSADVVLESAMPLSPSDIPGGTLTAPIVYVGNGSPAMLAHRRQGQDRGAAGRAAGAHGVRA